jgi:Cytochrome bd terminal oxidase subunit II
VGAVQVATRQRSRKRCALSSIREEVSSVCAHVPVRSGGCGDSRRWWRRDPPLRLNVVPGFAQAELDAALTGLRAGLDRALRVGAVAAVIWGWGVAQHPYPLPQTLTISHGAAPAETLTSLLIIFVVAVLVVLPALGLLFTLAQRSLVEETSRPSPPPPDAENGTTGTTSPAT